MSRPTTQADSVALVQHHEKCQGVQNFVLEQSLDEKRRPVFRVRCTICEGTTPILDRDVDWPTVWRRVAIHSDTILQTYKPITR